MAPRCNKMLKLMYVTMVYHRVDVLDDMLINF